jgi:hypothetical protein
MLAVVEDSMNYIHRVIGIASIVANISAATVHAENGVACQELIKDCLVSATEQRDACLQTVATHESCTSSYIGALLKKRVQVSGSVELSVEQGPAFLGPRIINKRCVANFDTAWSAALVKGPISKERMASLSSALEECAASDVPPIPHA